MTDIYKIRCDDKYIVDILPGGNRIAPNGITFNSYQDALDFLHEKQDYLLSIYNYYINLSEYIIEKYTLTLTNTISVKNKFEDVFMNDDDEEYRKQLLIPLYKSFVKNGFGCVSESFLNFLLTTDKYYSMMFDMIPPHMVQCPELFMDVGILTCKLEDLGAILLTCPDNIDKMHDITNIIKIRSKQVSK